MRRALDLLSLVATQDGTGVSLSEVVAICGLAKATTRRLLEELVHSGYAEKDPNSLRYRLGPESYVVGSIAERRYGIHRMATDILARIVASTEDAAFLSVRRGFHSVCLHREEATFPLRSHVLQAGDRHPLGVGAGSMAILAALPDRDVDAAIADNRVTLEQRFAGYTTEILWEGVRAARNRGYAVNCGLVLSESWAIGVPVQGAGGEVVGALSIATIRHRLPTSRQRQLGNLLQRESSVLSDRLRSRGSRQAGGVPRRDP